MKKLLSLLTLGFLAIGLTGCLSDAVINGNDDAELTEMFIGNKRCGNHGYTSNILSLYSDNTISIDNAHYTVNYTDHATSSYSGTYTLTSDKLSVTCKNDKDNTDTVTFEVDLTTTNDVITFTSELELGIEPETITYQNFKLASTLNTDTSIYSRYVSAGSSAHSILLYEKNCTCAFLYTNGSYVRGSVNKTVTNELTFTFSDEACVVDFSDENFFTLTYNSVEYTYLAF